MTASPKLMALAEALRSEKRFDDAIVIFDHLLGVRPDEAALRGLVATMGDKGQALEALDLVVAHKALYADPGALMADLQAQARGVVQKYEAHLQASDLVEAARHAGALVVLNPRDPSFLKAALSCSQALGRWTDVAVYADLLLDCDGTDPVGHEARAAVCKHQGDRDGEIRHRLVPLLSASVDSHPLVRLRDLSDLAGMILCQPLTATAEAQLDAIRDAAASLVVAVPDESEWATWAKHYRLLLEAVDLAVLRQRPVAEPDPDLAVMASIGRRQGWSGARATAERLGARVVFFAAADESYLALYARWYVMSILKYCDVSCVIVLHVIGGVERIAQVVDSLGIHDERLIVVADALDAEAMRGKSYDAPPKGLSSRPIAYFQSVRFLRLGAVLRNFGLPVFVSDIDLLLQRGVRDLLESTRDADVVLNENTLNLQAGSRLTANLLLVRPSEPALSFAAFLRAYLERALHRGEVTRWIDQVGLLMARHDAHRAGHATAFAYFDTASDINNVIYTAYQDHPFRFLSMYHGFDVSSLERDSRVLGRGDSPSGKND